jgi:hypothetical protein
MVRIVTSDFRRFDMSVHELNEDSVFRVVASCRQVNMVQHPWRFSFFRDGAPCQQVYMTQIPEELDLRGCWITSTGKHYIPEELDLQGCWITSTGKHDAVSLKNWIFRDVGSRRQVHKQQSQVRARACTMWLCNYVTSMSAAIRSYSVAFGCTVTHKTVLRSRSRVQSFFRLISTLPWRLKACVFSFKHWANQK